MNNHNKICDSCIYYGIGDEKVNRYRQNMFTRKEIYLLISLVEAQKESINLLRGFRSPNKEEQDENAYYNRLINKLKKL